LDRRLGGPQSRSGRCGEENNLAPAGIRTPAVQPIARRYTDSVNTEKPRVKARKKKRARNKERRRKIGGKGYISILVFFNRKQ
jgi:hypothetical protein